MHTSIWIVRIVHVVVWLVKWWCTTVSIAHSLYTVEYVPVCTECVLRMNMLNADVCSWAEWIIHIFFQEEFNLLTNSLALRCEKLTRNIELSEGYAAIISCTTIKRFGVGIYRVRIDVELTSSLNETHKNRSHLYWAYARMHQRHDRRPYMCACVKYWARRIRDAADAHCSFIFNMLFFTWCQDYHKLWTRMMFHMLRLMTTIYCLCKCSVFSELSLFVFLLSLQFFFSLWFCSTINLHKIQLFSTIDANKTPLNLSIHKQTLIIF